MLKTRVITGAVAGVAAIAALLFLPSLAIRVLVAIIGVMAAFELLACGDCKRPSLMIPTMLLAAALPFLYQGENASLIVIALMAYAAVTAIVQLCCSKTLSFDKIAFTVCATATVLLPLSCLAYIRTLPDHGLAYLFLTLIISWFSDMGAYFAGTFFGKHKLCEHISPKKTVEGLFGGIISSVLFCLLGAWIYQLTVLDSALHINYWQVALLAVVATPVSVVGDLFCSVIKRHFQIKDFGNIFPGHGGILDRFDSVIFVAPIVSVWCTLLPMVS